MDLEDEVKQSADVESHLSDDRDSASSGSRLSFSDPDVTPVKSMVSS